MNKFIKFNKIADSLNKLAGNIDVGFQWNSKNGVRKIVTKQTKPNGTLTYGVSTGESNFLELIEADDIEFEINRDEKNYEAQIKTKQKQLEEEKEKAKHESWLGFTDTMKTPTVRRRAITTLDKQVSINNKFDSRGQHIINLVKNGYTLTGTMMGKRALISPNTFFFEKDLTKIGLDFAEYLINNKVI